MINPESNAALVAAAPDMLTVIRDTEYTLATGGPDMDMARAKEGGIKNNMTQDASKPHWGFTPLPVRASEWVRDMWLRDAGYTPLAGGVPQTTARATGKRRATRARKRRRQMVQASRRANR